VTPPNIRLHAFLFVAAGLLVSATVLVAQATVPPQQPASRPSNSPAEQSEQNEQQDLQKAIDGAANDRAALVRNLEAFLKTYPQSQQRPQIYRAIVESSLKVDDHERATEYAERMVSLRPDDASINILAIQLLERYGDAAGWRRAISYCTRVAEQVERTNIADKSPRVSPESWQSDKNRDISSVLLIRGRLYQKLNDLTHSQKDFETSYVFLPTVSAAAKLGELAEIRQDPNTAILQYARAFALATETTGSLGRADLRKKIGNAWRLAHGSENGLGDYLLHSFDEVTASIAPARPIRNAGLKNPYEFTLRKAPSGTSFPFSETKGKVVVLNFWATWCGPCRELEPHFERIAGRYAGDKNILFFELNCDDDETLVPPYLEQEKPKTPVLFADNLETLFSVSSFPTTIILAPDGRVAFRSDGFDPDTVDKDLAAGIERALHPANPANPASGPNASRSSKP
jgi:thiol-disulfide isomerase/thioredoxin